MSNLSALEYIQNRSEATTGLFNQRLSVISANFAALNSAQTISFPSGNTLSLFTSLDASGNLHAGNRIGVGPTPSADTVEVLTIGADSSKSDYILFHDPSGSRSNYVIGSRVGGTADGLNIWDASGQTMIASFSKQSVRFFQNVVGPVFDTGGALASTYNAATFGTGADSKESRIQAAINQASLDGFARVYIPANMYPYSASSLSFIYPIQMVREGGDWSVYDALAYGAYGDGTHNDVPGILSAVSASPVSGGLVYVPKPPINWRWTQDLNISRNNVTLQWAPGTTLMNGNRLVVQQGKDNVSLIGSPSANLAFNGNPGGTYFDYQSAGTRGAFTIGSGAGRTQQFLIRDIGIKISGSSFSAVGLEMAGLQNFEIERVVVNGAINTNHIGMRLDGSGTPCYIGSIKFPYVVNAPTGIVLTGSGGGQVTAAVMIYGGELSGSTTSGIALQMTLADGCWVIGTDLENWDIGLDFNGAQNCIAFPRFENNTTYDVRWRGGSGNCAVWTGSSITKVSNAGGGILMSSARGHDGTAVILTDAATVATDASLGNTFQVTLGGNRTMGAPTNGFMGQRIVYNIFQNGTGGWTLAWNAAFVHRWTDAGNTANLGSNVAFTYDGVSWRQDGWQSPYQANFHPASRFDGITRVSNGQYFAAMDAGGANGVRLGTVSGTNAGFLNQVNSSTLDIMCSNATRIRLDSAGSINLLQNRLVSMRTIAASALTASAANTNVAVDEMVFTIQASGASFAINSGGTTWLFNSDASAKNT